MTHPCTCLGFCALDLGFSLLLLPSTLKYTLELIVFRPVEVFPGLVGLSNPVFRGFQISKYTRVTRGAKPAFGWGSPDVF